MIIRDTHEDAVEETTQAFQQRFTYVLQQMMFVSGETAEASAETTSMIEEIVRQQVIEMVLLAALSIMPNIFVFWFTRLIKTTCS